MTLKPFNSVDGNAIYNGDVLVYKYNLPEKLFGVKVIDYSWLTVGGTDEKFWAFQYGKVQDNKFVPDNETVSSVSWSENDQLKEAGYTYKWTPDALPKFKKGDFLTSSDGIVFFYEDESTVWKVTKGMFGNGSTYASLKIRTAEYGELKLYTTSLGTPFRKIVDGTK